LNELVTACLDEKNVEPLLEFPVSLMNDFEHEIVTWIFKYIKEYEAVPSVSRLTSEFKYFTAIRGDDHAPLKDLAQQTERRKRKEFVVTQIGEIESEIRESDDIPLEKMNKMMSVVGAYGSGLSRYSTFDRERYFRKGSLKIGIPMVDRVTGGIANGDFMILAGRLGTGKSTLTQWIVKNWWEQGHRILLVSKEMLPIDVFARVDGMVGRFNPLLIRTGKRDDVTPLLRVVSSIASHRKGEIYIPSQLISTPAQVAALAKNLDVDVVVVDGLYLLYPDGSYAQRWEKVADISNALKQTALDLQVPMLGTTQIKRVGTKDEYDPEDLAYSDALGQDADYVVMIKPSKAERARVEVQLTKNRQGPNTASVIFIDWDTMSIIDETTSVKTEEDWSKR